MRSTKEGGLCWFNRTLAAVANPHSKFGKGSLTGNTFKAEYLQIAQGVRPSQKVSTTFGYKYQLTYLITW